MGTVGVLKNRLYASPSGYGLVCCGLCTQGGALPLDEAACANELGAKLTLGYSMQPLRDKAAKSKDGLFQQPHSHQFFLVMRLHSLVAEALAPELGPAAQLEKNR